MQCSLPPHRYALDFSTINAFEIHYAKDHSNRCTSCGKNFPSPHFLTLHIDEKHNPLREELQAKGEKTYGCFVEGCEKKCSSPQKRRLHLIDKHAFPKVYNFYGIVDHGIDHASSMLRASRSHRRRVSTSNAPADAANRRRRASSQNANDNEPNPLHQPISLDARDVPKRKRLSSTTPDKDLEDLQSSMSALQFVPASVMRHQARSTSKWASASMSMQWPEPLEAFGNPQNCTSVGPGD